MERNIIRSGWDCLFRQVGGIISDLIAFDSIIVAAKVIEKISDNEIAQMINYLKITRQLVGRIVNFKHTKLESQRIVA